MKSLALAVLLLGSTAVSAEAAQSIDVERYEGRRLGQVVSYAVKFVCGKLPTATHPGFVPGQYQTAINIHNPNKDPVRFRFKAVVTNPVDKPPGKVSPFANVSVEANAGLEIDCINIRKLLELDPEKGFVVIETGAQRPLDVVAVYTANGG